MNVAMCVMAALMGYQLRQLWSITQVDSGKSRIVRVFHNPKMTMGFFSSVPDHAKTEKNNLALEDAEVLEAFSTTELQNGWFSDRTNWH